MWDENGTYIPQLNDLTPIDKLKVQLSLAILFGFVPGLSSLSTIWEERFGGLFSDIGSMFSESTEGLETAGSETEVGSSGGLVDVGGGAGETSVSLPSEVLADLGCSEHNISYIFQDRHLLDPLVKNVVSRNKGIARHAKVRN